MTDEGEVAQIAKVVNIVKDVTPQLNWETSRLDLVMGSSDDDTRLGHGY